MKLLLFVLKISEKKMCKKNISKKKIQNPFWLSQNAKNTTTIFKRSTFKQYTEVIIRVNFNMLYNYHEQKLNILLQMSQNSSTYPENKQNFAQSARFPSVEGRRRLT